MVSVTGKSLIYKEVLMIQRSLLAEYVSIAREVTKKERILTAVTETVDFILRLAD